jgi:transcription-repair coupling factor (superfamily II helicase)
VRRFRKKTASGRAVQGFFELQKGDLVVHLTHGIARYLGIEVLEHFGEGAIGHQHGGHTMLVAQVHVFA